MSKNIHEIPTPLALPFPELRALRQDRFKTVKLETEIDGIAVPFEMQLVREGLDPGSVDRFYLETHVDDVNQCAAECKFVLEDLESGSLFGCSLTDIEDHAIRRAMFAQYRVYAQSLKDDPLSITHNGTTRGIIESYSVSGVRCLRAIRSNHFKRFDPPAAKMSVANLLAGHLLRFETGRVFIETRSGDGLDIDSRSCIGDERNVVVCVQRGAKYYGANDPRDLLGERAIPLVANELGMEVFLLARSPDQVVPVHSSVLYVNDFDETDKVEPLEHLEVPHGRFEVCEVGGPSVGVALRLNDINYAALHGVFVRLKPGAVLDGTKKAYAIEAGESRDESVVWTGEALAEFTKYPAFRAKFDVYVQCESARQVLDRGDRLMVDRQVIHEIPGPDREFLVALMRLHPVRVADKPEYAIHDLGYADDVKVASGFLRGWYRDGRYWRMVGNDYEAYMSGGTKNVPFERNIYMTSDLGHARKRILVELPGFGVTYCRGVGNDNENPIMACVLLNADGGIVDEYGLHKFIGRWNDIVS